MAEELTNGTTAPIADVEMKEESQVDTSMNDIQAADPTDPNPPPQEQNAPAVDIPMPSQAEHLSTIAPATATPPVTATTRPGSMPPQPTARPEKPVAHGGPTRQYLNSNITPHLLEGMKYLAANEPEKPLAWLADFLMQRSKQVEG